MEPNCSFYDVSCIFSWWTAEAKALFTNIWNSIIEALADAIDSIPVPDFLINITSITLPTEIAYFVEPFELQLGMQIIVSAYIARFLLRRLPFIG